MFRSKYYFKTINKVNYVKIIKPFKNFNGYLNQRIKQIRCNSSLSAVTRDEVIHLTFIAPNRSLTKSYEQMPSIGPFNLIKNSLPGGKYYKLDSTQFLLALRKDFGNIYKLAGSFGRPDVIFTHNVEDFEKILRNEGIWPRRPGLLTLSYHRRVHRPDFFKGHTGLLTT